MRSARPAAFVLAAWLVAAALAGCQSSAPSSAPSGASATSAVGSSGDLPGATSDASNSPEASSADFPPDMIVGDGDFLLADPSVGLADLASHRASLTVSFDGTASAAVQKWTSVTTLAATKDPRAGVLTVEDTRDLEPAAPAWTAEQGGVAYSIDDAGTCASQVIDPEAPELEEPAVGLPGVWGGEAIGTETVNGIETNAYSIDEAALGLGGDAKATGKVWVAATSELVVRYEVTITAGPDVFGENVSGTSETRYELTGVNGSVEINIPAACPTGIVDAPLPPGATVVMSEPGVLTATVQSSVADVAAFYEDAAAGTGWKSAEAPGVTKTAAILKFSDDDLTIEVVVRAQDGGTGITILTGWK